MRSREGARRYDDTTVNSSTTPPLSYVIDVYIYVCVCVCVYCCSKIPNSNYLCDRGCMDVIKTPIVRQSKKWLYIQNKWVRPLLHAGSHFVCLLAVKAALTCFMHQVIYIYIFMYIYIRVAYSCSDESIFETNDMIIAHAPAYVTTLILSG